MLAAMTTVTQLRWAEAQAKVVLRASYQACDIMQNDVTRCGVVSAIVFARMVFCWSNPKAICSLTCCND